MTTATPRSAHLIKTAKRDYDILRRQFAETTKARGTPESLGGEDFDLVFVGDMLVHTMAPLKALDVLAGLCRGTMIISQDLPEFGGDTPVMLYYGGGHPDGDSRSWWHPNEACWTQMLKWLGFADVQVAGHHDGVVRRDWVYYDRTILVATK